MDARGERLTALVGFAAAGLGLAVLAIPGLPLHSPVTIAPLVPLGLGLGMLFAPASRAALNSAPSGSHGRVSALLSLGRLLGAAVGAALAGAAISGPLTASTVYDALLAGCAACLALGMPAALRLGPRRTGVRDTPSATSAAPNRARTKRVARGGHGRRMASNTSGPLCVG
ncbi:MAG: hypothetical protein JO325_08605 [Solirubrobacterales bacterium]|nr:hypothetical protein [Solirubrobacterales bacterium]